MKDNALFWIMVTATMFASTAYVINDPGLAISSLLISVSIYILSQGE